LVAWLNGLPEVQAVLAAQFHGQPIVEPNLSAWRKGGYHDWEEEQRTLGAAATLLEESDCLQETAKDILPDRMTLVLTAKMALELQRLNSAPDGEQKSKIWRALMGSLILLKRGNTQGEKLAVEREKLGFRRELHQKEREAEFWQWIEKKEHRTKILDRLLTPEQNAEEIARRNEEKRRKIKAILGIH